jgi:uncharacterized membrane protein YfcA
LGVGGGVVAVPVLIEVFDLIGLAKGPAVALAVGTAQISILIASLTAASAHWRAGTIDGALVRALGCLLCWQELALACVGALASAAGVGGGTLSTPVLALFAFPVRRAIGGGALFNLVIAAPATMFFLAHDLGAPGRTTDAMEDVALS